MNKKMSKTIAQQLNIKDFPFVIKDKNGNRIYYEISDNTWIRREYDSDGNQIFSQNSSGFSARWEYDCNGDEVYYENSKGVIRDNRSNEVIEVNGIKYQRIDQ